MTRVTEIKSSKNIKLLVFASLIVVMILPFSVVDSAPNERVHENTKVKTIIKNVPSHKEVPDIVDRNELIKSHTITKSEYNKVILENKIKVLDIKIQKWYDDRFDQSKYNLAREKQEVLSQYIIEQSTELGIKKFYESLPITMIGYDYVDNTLEISINPTDFETDNIKDHIKSIREVIGNDVDITISPMEVLHVQSCTSRTASVCDPIKGGVAFDANGSGACTVGFKATFDGDTGFVTAGHCVDEMIGSFATINQPVHNSTDIGNVESEYFYDNTDCDCGFVSVLDSERSMDNGIYGNYDPVTTTNPFVGMTVKLSGAVAGIEYGTVLNINTETWADIDMDGTPDVFLTEMILADYPQSVGDSGDPIV